MTGQDKDMLRPWQQSAITDRRSVIGALAIVLVAVFYVVGVPFLEENVEVSLETDEAGRFVVDDYTTILLPDGWSVESQNELLTTLTDGTHQFFVIPSNPADEATPAETLQPVYDSYGADPANERTPIETFTTDSGGEAAGYRVVLATDPSGNGSAVFAIIENGRSFQPFFTGPGDLADPFFDEAEAIVRTVEISVDPRGGS